MAFSFYDKDVSGTEDFFDGCDCFGSKRHGSNGLGTADFDNLGGSGFYQGVEQGWVDFAVCTRWRGSEDFWNTRGLCKCGGHQSGGNEWGFASGDINSDTVIGGESLAYFDTFAVFRFPVLTHAAFGKGVDVVFADGNGFFDVVIDSGVGFINLRFGNKEGLGGEFETIKTLSVFEDGCISTLLYISNDTGDNVFHLTTCDSGCGAAVEFFNKSGVGGFLVAEDFHCEAHTCSLPFLQAC